MKIAVIPNLNKRDAEAYTARIVSLLRQCGAEVLMHASLASDYGGTVACVSHEEMIARCDVDDPIRIARSDTISVRRSERATLLIKMDDRNFYDIVNRKILHSGG